MARRIAGDNDLAMDVLQESWIRVLEHVCAWVRTIVRNCALDIHRGRRSLVNELSADIADLAQNPEALAQQQQLTRLLREMVAALLAAYRDVCLMRYGQELSTTETARRLGISRSNVSTRLNRAVRMLRSRLDARLR